jgi:indolepyruvate decarboxylase
LGFKVSARTVAKYMRTAPRSAPAFQPPTRLSSQFNQSLTQERFWQRVQDFIQVGDVVLADIGTCSAGMAGLRRPHRRQPLSIGDGGFQTTAQELSTILRRGLKPIFFLVNNNGYTIERLILGPNSSYSEINQWQYAEAASFFDTQDQAIACSQRLWRQHAIEKHCC